MSQQVSVKQEQYTTADAMLEALQELGVDYIFANLGSDHPALIESFTKFHTAGKEMPQILICQHEMVALSAAHGYAQLTGKPQAVIVHVDCGTQNLGAAVQNAAKGRIPVLIFAGTSPATQEGELTGSRNEYIHWVQDVFDQRGIVREYMKYTNEIRTGRNVKQLLYRASQLSQSDPQGPVYLTAAREVLEEEIEPRALDVEKWGPVEASAVPPQQIKQMMDQLVQAEEPLIVTSFLGRQTEAVAELIKFAERLAIPVLESAPYYMNFPADHPLHLGYVWNEQTQNEHLSRADFILVLDSDVPWMPLQSRPAEDCLIYYVDVDPLKEQMPLWYIPSERFYRADSFTALQQFNDYLDQHGSVNDDQVARRFNRIENRHDQQRQEWKKLQTLSDEGAITPEYLTACLAEVFDEDTIIMSETITNFSTVNKHLPRNKPGNYFSLGAAGLGWNGGAAIGAKLAEPDKLVVSLTGDGCFVFSQPTAVHWMARRYETPFLTIIYNNKKWNAPKFSTLGVHPQGIAHQNEQFWVDFEPSSDLAKVAEAAGGAYACTVEQADELKDTLLQAIDVVKGGRSAVVDVHLTS